MAYNDFTADLDPDDVNVQRAWDAASTPRRQTKVIFDSPSPTLRDSAWMGTRYGAQICSPSARGLGKSGPWTRRVRYWPSAKMWTLEPVQERWRWTEQIPLGLTMDDIVYKSGAIGAMALLAIQTRTMRMNAVPFGTGMTHEASSTFEQEMFRKIVSADGSWDESLSMPALPNPFTEGTTFGNGITANTLDAPSVPLDIVCHTQQTQRENLGAFLRWMVPGHQNSYPDYILTFFFGQYGLGIAGDGMAYLFEWARDTAESSPAWRMRHQWQYCPPQAVCGVNHTMTIFPHLGQRGEQQIIFSSRQVGAGAVTWTHNHVPTQEVLYVSSEINRQGQVPATYPPHTTTRNYFRLDVRRDLRLAWSLARLMFWDSGQIIDAAWEMPPAPSSRDWRVQLHFRSMINPVLGLPAGEIQAVGFNGRDSAELTSLLVREGLYTVENNAGGDAAPYFLLQLNGGGGEDGPGEREAQSYTPILYGYSLERDADIAAAATPEEGSGLDPITLSVRSVSITDPGPNPKAAGGEVETGDMFAEHPRLRSRGCMHTKVTIEYWPKAGEAYGPMSDWPAEAYNGTKQKIVLHNGLAMRMRHSKLSPDNDEGTCTPRRIQAPLVGMAAIAGEINTASITYQQFAIAPEFTPADTRALPYKVTDAIRFMLATRFRDSYIDIPDLPLRLFGALGQGKGDLEFEPSTDIIDRCSAMARNYLGMYLVYNNNAGIIEPDGSPGGAWQLKRVQPADGAAVARFFTAPLSSPFPGMNPCGYIDGGLPGIPLAEPLREYTNPPEANHIWVFAAPPISGERYMKVDCHLYNYQSYKVPGSSNTPNPLSPHYIGHEKLLVVPAPELWLAGDYVRTRQACEIVGRRLLQFAGCASKLIVAPGPLAIIWDYELERYRPLMYGDLVTVNGESGWYVRSCSPSYNLDTEQTATYELEKKLGHNDPGVEEE